MAETPVRTLRLRDDVWLRLGQRAQICGMTRAEFAAAVLECAVRGWVISVPNLRRCITGKGETR